MSDVTAKVREYGTAMLVSPIVFHATSPNYNEMTTSLFESQAKEIREVLDICADAEIIEDFHIIDGPVTDPLLRFKNIGWYGKFASANYDKMEEHFHCRKQHQPEEISLGYINEIIKRYALQQSLLDDKDEDYL